MSTQFSEPKFDKFESIDGWIFPDENQKKFAADPFEKLRENDQLFAPINSFEYQQGIFGQYRTFYSLKNRNNYTRACLRMCITPESLMTSNLNQEDKVCARECVISQEKFQASSNLFLEKKKHDKIRELAPLNNAVFFS